MIEDLKQMAGAAPILLDWLGDGMKPVDFLTALNRSRFCFTCHENKEPNWWHKNVSNPIAQAIIKQLEAKNELDLSVDNESKLNMCRVCGCAIKLKIWTPIEHIAAHTTPEQLEQYPAFCWIKREITEG